MRTISEAIRLLAMLEDIIESQPWGEIEKHLMQLRMELKAQINDAAIEGILMNVLNGENFRQLEQKE